MASLSIVEDLDVVEHRIREFEPRLPPLSVQQFNLHARPEGFHHRVIKGVADGSEGRYESGVADPFGERPRGELRPVVRVNDRASFDSTLLDGHVEGIDDEVGVLARVDGPTNNAT